MGSAILAVWLGRLFMKEFHHWDSFSQTDSCEPWRIESTGNTVTFLTLRNWRYAAFLTQAVSMGTVQSRNVVSTDPGLFGSEGVHEGQTVRGLWSSTLQQLHINYLGPLAMFLAFGLLLPFLHIHHILVRTDNAIPAIPYQYQRFIFMGRAS